MNPMQIFKLKGLLTAFQENHPKFIPFLGAAKRYVAEGSIIEVKVKNAEGEEILCNIRVQPQDIELFQVMKSFATSADSFDDITGV